MNTSTKLAMILASLVSAAAIGCSAPPGDASDDVNLGKVDPLAFTSWDSLNMPLDPAGEYQPGRGMATVASALDDAQHNVDSFNGAIIAAFTSEPTKATSATDVTIVGASGPVAQKMGSSSGMWQGPGFTSGAAQQGLYGAYKFQDTSGRSLRFGITTSAIDSALTTATLGARTVVAGYSSPAAAFK